MHHAIARLTIYAGLVLASCIVSAASQEVKLGLKIDQISEIDQKSEIVSTQFFPMNTFISSSCPDSGVWETSSEKRSG